MFNPDKLHDSHHLDSLVAAARLHPTPELIQKLVDLELDTRGNWVGFDQANFIWHKAVGLN